MYVEPSFDIDRYHEWLKERAEAMGHAPRSHFITISREFGCNGYPISMELCNLLNEQSRKYPWLVFSHPIMEKLVSNEKLGVDMIHKVSEKRYSFINWFIDGMVPDYLQSPQSQTFERMRTLILNLAEKGNCIIIGGGAQIVTRELDPAKFTGIHIRVIGSFSFRVGQIMQRCNLNKKEAEKQVTAMQHARAKFVEDFTGKSPANTAFYHMVLNNERSSPDVIARVIFQYAKERGFL